MFSFMKSSTKSNRSSSENPNDQMNFIKEMNDADIYKKVKKANRLQKRIASSAK